MLCSCYTVNRAYRGTPGGALPSYAPAGDIPVTFQPWPGLRNDLTFCLLIQTPHAPGRLAEVRWLPWRHRLPTLRCLHPWNGFQPVLLCSPEVCFRCPSQKGFHVLLVSHSKGHSDSLSKLALEPETAYTLKVFFLIMDQFSPEKSTKFPCDPVDRNYTSTNETWTSTLRGSSPSSFVLPWVLFLISREPFTVLFASLK